MAFPGYGDSATFHGFSSNANLQDAYLHATLQQIEHLANEDVEMKAPVSEYSNFVVVDTNILLHHLEVLQQFVEDIERTSVPTIVIVPGVVILELDRQKKKNGLGFFARRGSSWLLEKVGKRRSVKCQAEAETCKSTGSWKKREPGEVQNEMYNDSLILDCCLFFGRNRKTFLCSADNNLCLESETAGIQAIVPGYQWCSRDLARSIYGNFDGLDGFERYRESYRNPLTTLENPAAEDEDSMMVDDEDANWTPQHPLNLLHEAVIDHFTRLLIELVGRVGGDEVCQETTEEEEANLSRHAPRRRHYRGWNAAECIEYLNGRLGIKARNPPAERFLLKVNPKVATPYARRGWEWSRRDWEIALDNLRATGSGWGDVAIPESLYYLQPHIDAAFDR